jgi:hypothetical protein
MVRLDEKDISLLVEHGGFDRVKLVVRHAERPLFKGLKAPHDVSITDKGMREAERLGGLLDQSGLTIRGCSSSPVRRCIQTAELIGAGNGYKGKVETSPTLGGSGLFMDDGEELDHTLDTYTLEEIIGGQLRGRKVPGMRPLESGLKIFMGQVMSDRSRDFEVFVSHDLFVCPAVHYLTETDYSAAGNTGFLEGFFIAERGGRTWIVWRSHFYDVTDRLRSLFQKGA